MEEEITKWGKKDPATLLSSMAYPENLEAIEKGQAGLPFRKDSDSEEDENVPSPQPVTVQVKKEIPSTPQKQVEDLISGYTASPVQQHDMDQEYLNHALEWGMQNIDTLSVDLLTTSPLTSSPVATHGSPLPHTPSRTAQKVGVTNGYHGNFFTSSPSRIHAASPSAVRSNLFGVTPPRTLSALN